MEPAARYWLAECDGYHAGLISTEDGHVIAEIPCHQECGSVLTFRSDAESPCWVDCTHAHRFTPVSLDEYEDAIRSDRRGA